MCQKASSISSALEVQFSPRQFLEKYSFWHSGFISPAVPGNFKREKKFVYAGGGTLDYSLIKKIAKKHPEYTFQIVGNHHKNISNKNIIFTGFIPYKEYLQMIQSAAVFIIPFTAKYGKTLYQQSYSAKIFVPMSLGIPILTKRHGLLQSDDSEKKMYVYTTHKEALFFLDNTIKAIESGQENFIVSDNTKDYLFSRRPEQKTKDLHEYFQAYFKKYSPGSIS
jgi:hypothetical protein